MIVKRTSMFTDIQHERDLPITQQQLERWGGGELIQNVFPHLSASDREYIMTGVTKEEWDEEFRPKKRAQKND